MGELSPYFIQRELDSDTPITFDRVPAEEHGFREYWLVIRKHLLEGVQRRRVLLAVGKILEDLASVIWALLGGGEDAILRLEYIVVNADLRLHYLILRRHLVLRPHWHPLGIPLLRNITKVIPAKRPISTPAALLTIRTGRFLTSFGSALVLSRAPAPSFATPAND